jgi:hypothetical protein
MLMLLWQRIVLPHKWLIKFLSVFFLYLVDVACVSFFIAATCSNVDISKLKIYHGVYCNYYDRYSRLKYACGHCDAQKVRSEFRFEKYIAGASR